MAACAAVRRRRVGGRRSPISRRVCPPRPQRVRHSAARPAAQRLAAARIATDLDAIYLSGRMGMQRPKQGSCLLLVFVTSSPALVLDKYPTQWTNIGCVGIESWGTPRASHAAPPGCPVPFDGQQMCTYMGIDRSVAFRSFRARRMLRSQRLASAAPPCRPKLEARHRLLPCFPGGLQSKLASLPRLLPCSLAGSQSSGASGRGATVARRQARSRRERTPQSCACLPQARGQQSQR